MMQEYMRDYENIISCLSRGDYEGAAEYIDLFSLHSNTSTPIAIVARVNYASALVCKWWHNFQGAYSIFEDVINTSPEPELRKLAHQEIAQMEKDMRGSINDVTKRFKGKY